jgi:hypothetical protein
MDKKEMQTLKDKFRNYQIGIAPAFDELTRTLSEARERHDAIVRTCIGLYGLRKKAVLREIGLTEDSLEVAEKVSKRGRKNS